MTPTQWVGTPRAAPARRAVDLLDPAHHAAVGQRALEHRRRHHRLRQRHRGAARDRVRAARRDPREPQPRGRAAVHHDRERRAPGRDERDEQAGGARVHRRVRGAASSRSWMPRHPLRSTTTTATRSPPICRRRRARRSTARRSRPRGAAQEYLQYHYVIPYEDWEDGDPDRGRRRRQRVVGGPRAVPRLLQAR